MKRVPRVRLNSDMLTRLLAGQPIEVVHRGSLPQRGESYPVTLTEPTETRVLIVRSKLRAGTQRVWTLTLVLDRSEAPMLLNAESSGGVITPLGEAHSEEEAAAHGYTESAAKALDCGDAIPHADVLTSSETQAAAERFTAQKIDQFTRRRVARLEKRLNQAAHKARSHGVELDGYFEAIEAAIAELEEARREAA